MDKNPQQFTKYKIFRLFVIGLFCAMKIVKLAAICRTKNPKTTKL